MKKVLTIIIINIIVFISGCGKLEDSIHPDFAYNTGDLFGGWIITSFQEKSPYEKDPIDLGNEPIYLSFKEDGTFRITGYNIKSAAGYYIATGNTILIRKDNSYGDIKYTVIELGAKSCTMLMEDAEGTYAYLLSGTKNNSPF